MYRSLNEHDEKNMWRLSHNFITTFEHFLTHLWERSVFTAFKTLYRLENLKILWFSEFCCGRSITNGAERWMRPIEVTTPEMFHKIKINGMIIGGSENDITYVRLLRLCLSQSDKFTTYLKLCAVCAHAIIYAQNLPYT